MQREKKEAEEAARSKFEGVELSAPSNQPSSSNEVAGKASASKESTGGTGPPALEKQEHKKQQTGSSTTRPKHQKTQSEVTREATFASLQRALNAAVAGRDQYGLLDTNSSDTQVSPRPVIPPNNKITDSPASHDSHGQAMFGRAFTGLEPGQDSSAPGASETSHDAFGYGSLNTAFTSAEEPLSARALDDTTLQGSSNEMLSQNIHLQPPTEEWVDHASAPSQPFPSNRAASDAGVPYSTMQYSLQPLQVPLSRRASSGEQANTLEGIAIQQPGSQPDRTAVPKETGKEVDIAARRKRPRPSAIGTSRSGRTLAASTMSPTAQVPSATSVPSGVRQSKSAQSLNSRFAGVKKASATQRAPLNLSAFTDPGSLNTTKADMSSMLQPPVANSSLAPPTPITPETLHHLLPTSPADGGYCLSAHPSTQFFPMTRTLPINIASPPATPLPADMMQFSYPNTAPPLSAPAQYTTFPDYATRDGVPLTARSWADSAPVPSPDMVFQDNYQMLQGDISPIEFDPAVEHGGQVARSEGIPSPLIYPGKNGGMSSSEETKMRDFEIHEFPGQYETHRYVAQQLPSQKRKNYVFANKTPIGFGGGSYAS